jgi:hypothetical protein
VPVWLWLPVADTRRLHHIGLGRDLAAIRAWAPDQSLPGSDEGRVPGTSSEPTTRRTDRRIYRPRADRELVTYSSGL